jgi:serine/threonine-protein kinase
VSSTALPDADVPARVDIDDDWPRLLALLDEALDRPASDLPGWLAGLDLPASTRDALAALLAERHALESANFLATLPRVTPPPRFSPGVRLGPWRLLEPIGEGGASTVWLAERADDQVRRRVALKLPHAGPGQELLAARLLREREILASLTHPNICRLYDVGIAPDGTPWLAMEHVEGATLLAHADAHGLDVAARVALFRQVLAAVQHAHGHLVLHRDLKPANILVNAAGEPMLLDFGIARLLEDAKPGSAATELTGHAGRPLTLAYASPEQVGGRPVGTASDVYSLGVVLYELLCGERPYRLDRPTAGCLEEAVLSQDPWRPSRRVASSSVDALRARGATSRGLRRTLAGDLDAIVIQAMRKAPEDRYGSADALSADLARWQAGLPVSARAPSFAYRASRFVARHALAVSAGVVVAVALGATTAVAVMRGLEARREAAEAMAARDFMTQLFRGADPDTDAGRDPTGRELLARGRAALLAAAARDPALPADDLLASIARAQFDLEDFPGADASWGLLLGRLRSVDSPAATRLRATAWLARAEMALSTGRLDEAHAALARARVETSRPDADDASRRTALRIDGHLALHEGRLDAARASLAAYLAAAARATDEPADLRVAARLALAKAESGARHADAARALLRAADAEARAASAGDPGLAFREVAAYRVSLDLDGGRYADIEGWLPDTVSRCATTLGAHAAACRVLLAQRIRVLLKLGHAEVAVVQSEGLHSQLEDTRSPLGQLEAAVVVARSLAAAGRPVPDDVLARLEAADGSAADPDLLPAKRLLALDTRAEVAVLAGRPDEALAWTSRAHALAARSHLATSREAAKTDLFEGLARHAQGHEAAALQAFGPLCDEGHLAGSRLPVLDRLLSLDCVAPLANAGRRAEARALIDRALPVLRDGLGPASPTVARAQALAAALAAPTPLHAGPRPDHRPDPFVFT